MTSDRIVPLSEYHRLPQVDQTSDFYKRLLEVVCNNATLALFIMDEHQQCVYMNAAAETLTGYRLSETKGRALHDVVHHTRPDGRPYPLCECPIDQAFPQNNREQGEEVFVHKDGHFYPVAYTASPIREGDRITGTIIEVRDITHEKLAEQAKQEARRREQELQAEAEATQRQITHLLEHMTDAFVAFDREWCYTYANPAAVQLLQKSPEELIGKNVWQEVFPNEVGGLAYHKLHRALKEQVSVSWQEFGQPVQRWLEVRAYPSTEGIAVYFQDITDRKRAEEALRQSEERLQVALKNAPITVFNQDCELKYTWIYNPAAELANAELIGKHDVDLLPAEEAEILTQIKRQVLETGIGAREEVTTTVQGQTLYHDLTVEPLRNLESEIIGVSCAAVNITQLKQAELALRQSETIFNAFIASSPVGMAFFDPNWRYIYANDALADINGIPLSEHLGRTVAEVIPQWAPVIEPIFQQVMQTKTPLLNQEVIGTTNPVDLVRHCLVNYFPVCLPDGEVIGVGVTDLDITERRQAEEALRRSEERLRVSQELSLDAFTILNSVRDVTGALVDFEWTYVNPKAAQTLQHPANELVGRRLLEVLPGNQLNSELFERYVRVVETGKPHDIELSYDADGITGWFRNMSVKLEDGIAVFFSDITERKQAEAARLRLAEEREQLLQTLAEERARFEAVLRQMPEGVMIADVVSGQLVLSNEQANQILRYAYDLNYELEDYAPQVPFQAHWPDGRPYAAADYPLVRSLRTGEVISHEEIEIRYQDGNRIFIDTSSSPVFNNQGQMISAVTVFQDITQRKRIEAELQEGKRILDALMEYIPEGITIADAPDVTIRRISRYGQQLTGKTSEVLANIPASAHPDHWEIFHLDGITLATSAELPLTRATQQGEVITNEEWILRRADGTRICISCDAGPIEDENGHLIGGVIAWRDTTERKLTEAALRESEARFRGVVESNMVGIIFWNAAGCITDANEMALQMLGYSQEELKAGLMNWQDITPPEFHELDAAVIQSQLLVTGVCSPFEKAYIRKDGTQIPILIGGALLPGYTDRGVAYFLDITDRKQAEENLRLSEHRYRTLAHAVAQLMWVNDPQGRIQFYNQRWQEYTGIVDLALGVGLWAEVIHPDDFATTLATRMQAIQAGQPYEIECRLKRADQTYRWHLARVVPSKDEQGQILCWFGTAMDIDDRKQAEAEREQLLVREQAAREAAEAASRIKDEFLAVVSHELRSPLNPSSAWSNANSCAPDS
ncbi:MAG: PAS domain S-box protein [Cyanobacteria bacterium RM1_2_2]|nr:PAS domain S-box protein [Cyanobacteria bacterium RM1_2_2]